MLPGITLKRKTPAQQEEAVKLGPGATTVNVEAVKQPPNVAPGLGSSLSGMTQPAAVVPPTQPQVNRAGPMQSPTQMTASAMPNAAAPQSVNSMQPESPLPSSRFSVLSQLRRPGRFRV